MEVVVKLKSIKNHDFLMSGSYEVSGQTRFGTEALQVIDIPYGSDQKVSSIKTHNFTTRDTEFEYKFNVDDDGNPINDIDKRTSTFIEKFLCHHPLVTVNGKAHGNTKMEFVDVQYVHVKLSNSMKVWDNIRRAANFFYNATMSELRSICFYYGFNPTGLKRNEIILKFVDFSTGLLFSGFSLEGRASGDLDQSYKLLNDFMKDWVENDPTGGVGVRETKVLVEKGVAFGAISVKNNSGGTAYYIMGTPCGTNIEDVVHYLMLVDKDDNKAARDFVERTVNKNDKFEEELQADEITRLSRQSKYKDADSVDVTLLKQSIIKRLDDLDEKGVKHGIIRKWLRNMGAEKLAKIAQQIDEVEKGATVTMAPINENNS